MTDFEREKSILRQLAEAREAIKRKHQLIKRGKDNLEKTLNETFKPIVDPLKDLIEVTDQKKINEDKIISIKPEKKNKITFEKLFKSKEVGSSEDKTSYFNNTTNEFNTTLKPFDDTFESAIGNDNVDDYNDEYNPETSINESNDTTAIENIEKTSTSVSDQLLSDSVLGNYIHLLHDSSSNKGKLDKTFGVRLTENNYVIGDSPIYFEKNKVIVNDETYTATPGLMELLFHKEPDSEMISSLDQKNYLKILENTNAHRKKNDTNGEYRNKHLKKFKTFIAPNLSPNITKKRKSIDGSGLLPTHKIARRNTTFDFVWWNDPNELVDRLRLLIAEQAAGNPSHINEIHSIIEELREADYIY